MVYAFKSKIRVSNNVKQSVVVFREDVVDQSLNMLC